MTTRRVSRASTPAAAAALVAALVCLTARAPEANAPATDDRTIAHLLDRVTFSARPGDIDRVRRMGIVAYVDEQLHPERIDDGALQARLAGFETLTLSNREIAERYGIPAQQARQARARAQADAVREQRIQKLLGLAAGVTEGEEVGFLS